MQNISVISDRITKTIILSKFSNEKRLEEGKICENSK